MNPVHNCARCGRPRRPGQPHPHEVGPPGYGGTRVDYGGHGGYGATVVQGSYGRTPYPGPSGGRMYGGTQGFPGSYGGPHIYPGTSGAAQGHYGGTQVQWGTPAPPVAPGYYGGPPVMRGTFIDPPIGPANYGQNQPDPQRPRIAPPTQGGTTML